MLKLGFQGINIKFIHNIFQMFNAMYQEFILLISMALDIPNRQLYQSKAIIIKNEIVQMKRDLLLQIKLFIKNQKQNQLKKKKL